ncbi:MAG TPA: DNA-binding protein, partial [Hyphomonadaceae bacterium]|nr:DNA-binding protein [Hyphomonadaceae bacterium]
VELISANPAYPVRKEARASIRWMARILWASQ